MFFFFLVVLGFFLLSIIFLVEIIGCINLFLNNCRWEFWVVSYSRFGFYLKILVQENDIWSRKRYQCFLRVFVQFFVQFLGRWTWDVGKEEGVVQFGVYRGWCGCQRFRKELALFRFDVRVFFLFLRVGVILRICFGVLVCQGGLLVWFFRMQIRQWGVDRSISDLEVV